MQTKQTILESIRPTYEQKYFGHRVTEIKQRG